MEKEAINAAISKATGLSGDFYSDLNAMHESVTIFTPVQRRVYVNTLWVVVNPHTSWDEGSTSGHFFNYINATAHQRAEAFLRTIEKWKE